MLPPAFGNVLMQYDPMQGSSTGDLERDGRNWRPTASTRELAFPNALLGMMGYPDYEIRDADLPRLQRVPRRVAGALGRHLLRRRARQLVGRRGRAAQPAARPRRSACGPSGSRSSPAITLTASRSTSTAIAWRRVWDAIEESGLPVSHHIGEGPISSPCSHNGLAVSMVHQAAPFREMFARYVLGGLLDRHPGLRVGWFEGGINWVLPAIQDAEHMHRLVPPHARRRHRARRPLLLGPPHVLGLHGRSAGPGDGRPASAPTA